MVDGLYQILRLRLLEEIASSASLNSPEEVALLLRDRQNKNMDLRGFALKVGFDAKVPRLMQKWESYMPNPTPLAVTTRQCS